MTLMPLTFQQIVFYAFAGLTVLFALLVVIQSNPVRSVLALVFCFFSSAVLWILLQAEFLALILVLVYVGAVMTLFLFVVMMLNIDVEVLKTRAVRWLPLGLMFVAALVVLLYRALPDGMLLPAQATATSPDVQAIGDVLYTHYVLAFELAAVILLVAIIAAIMLVHRPSSNSKQQSIREQIMVNRADRVRLVAMPTEHPEE